MGLSWQQGPLSGVSRGHFLTPTHLPERLLSSLSLSAVA